MLSSQILPVGGSEAGLVLDRASDLGGKGAVNYQDRLLGNTGRPRTIWVENREALLAQATLNICQLLGIHKV